MPPFKVVSDFAPAGDQPAAIAGLSQSIDAGNRFQTLLGITGSGKSATIAWTIEQVQRPTLVIAPNKSLAAQLANEFREFFPDNRVEYFVSYYDYYQPEAYMPSSDTYIEKDSSINDEIDRLRHSATSALLTRRDVIVVASVVLHLRPRRPGGVQGPTARTAPGRGARPALDPAPAGRHAVRAQRHEPRARQVPGTRRHHRGAPGLRRDGRAHRAVRRRDRAHRGGRSAHRREGRRPRGAHPLPGHALRDGRRAPARWPSPASRTSCRSVWPTSRSTASCSRPNGCACGRSTTSR